MFLWLFFSYETEIILFLGKYPITVFNFKVKSDEVFLPGNKAGILFDVHSPFEAVDPFQKSVFMKPGRTYIIYVIVVSKNF